MNPLTKTLRDMPIRNEFIVATQGGDFVFVNPPKRGERISPERALQMAAWIVCMSLVEAEDFEELCNRVGST